MRAISKSQIPGSSERSPLDKQAPIVKAQNKNKDLLFIGRMQQEDWNLNFGPWSLSGSCSLELGASYLNSQEIN